MYVCIAIERRRSLDALSTYVLQTLDEGARTLRLRVPAATLPAFEAIPVTSTVDTDEWCLHWYVDQESVAQWKKDLAVVRLRPQPVGGGEEKEREEKYPSPSPPPPSGDWRTPFQGLVDIRATTLLQTAAQVLDRTEVLFGDALRAYLALLRLEMLSTG